MCNVSLVLKDQDGDGLNSVNKEEVESVVKDANKIYNEIKDAA
jgi:hypothetical protein